MTHSAIVIVDSLAGLELGLIGRRLLCACRRRGPKYDTEGDRGSGAPTQTLHKDFDDPFPDEREAAARPPLLAPVFAMSLVEQRECPQRHTGRQVLQVGVAAALRIDAAKPTHDRDILLAVFLPGHGLTDDSGRRLEAP